MGPAHRFVLSLGSNINPETNLRRALRYLRSHGNVVAVSGAWKSHAVGTSGPDFLNICVELESDFEASELKQQVLRPIEAQLGRQRGRDQNAPRPIDIDVVLADNHPLNLPRWSFAFVIVPMAELLPDIDHPTKHKRLAEVAVEARAETWIVQHGAEFLEGEEEH